MSTNKELKAIFVDDKPFSKKWSAAEKKIAMNLRKEFTGKMVFSVFTPDGNDMSYKKDSFPVLYRDHDFLFMLDDKIVDLNLKIERLTQQIASAKDKNLKALLQSD